MNHHQKNARILGIAPSSRGFGFVVMEEARGLIAWGGRTAERDKNAESRAKAERLMEQYRPDVLVLEDAVAKGSRRALRIQALNGQLAESARKRKVKVALLSGKQLRNVLLGDPEGTKQEMAEMLAGQFPDELGARLPRRRRAWTSQDGRMDLFDAAALAVAYRIQTRKRRLRGANRNAAAFKLEDSEQRQGSSH
jgi:Holliday junction resolvasome RuvABC endonuclease subunit